MDAAIARQIEIAAALHAADPWTPPANVDGSLDVGALADAGRRVRFTQADLDAADRAD